MEKESLNKKSWLKNIMAENPSILIVSIVTVFILALLIPLFNVSYISFTIDDSPSIKQIGGRFVGKFIPVYDPNSIRQVIKSSPDFVLWKVILFSTKRPIITQLTERKTSSIKGVYDVNITVRELNGCSTYETCRVIENMFIESLPSGVHTNRLNINLKHYNEISVEIEVFSEDETVWKSEHKIKV